MKISSRLKQHAVRMVWLLPVLLGTATVQAQAPAVTSTLDVCHDATTGKWRYSGVVSLAGKSLSTTSSAAVEYRIQNKTSALGYADALLAQAQAPLVLPGSTTRIASFSIEAPPLSLGTLRSAARVHLSDPMAPGTALPALETQAEFDAAVCGCPPAGCVRTQGYWKSKPGVAWPAPYSRNAMFFSSGLTWQQILDTPPKGGNAYLILAHQYIAGLLNRAGGASAPSGVQTVIGRAGAYFAGGSNLDSCGGSLCDTQISWAGILDTYNNGQYPGAPQHCPE